MWLATVANRDWPSAPGLTAAEQRAELLAHLDTAVARRLNAVVFQVRPTADALWPSPYEPWSQYLTGTQGKDPGWDPLGTAVDGGPRRAVSNCTPGSTRTASPTTPTRAGSSPPTRPGSTRDWVVPYGGKLYYNPGLPEVRALRPGRDAGRGARATTSTPCTWTTTSTRIRWPARSSTTTRRTTRYGGGFPDRAAWRRDNIDRLVRETAARIKAIRPGTRFGISPFGVWRNAATDPLGSDTRAGVQTYDDLHADTRKWVQRGLDRLHRARSSTGTSASPPPTTPSCCPGGPRSCGAAGRRAVHRRGAVQGGRPGAARGLAGPGRTVPAPHPRRATTRRCAGTVFFSAKEVRGRPDRGDGAGGRRPLPAAGGAAALTGPG